MSDPVFNPTGLIDRAALEFLRSKKLLPGFSHYDVWLYQHAVAFTVAKMMDADMLAEVKDAVETAQRNGTSFEVFKQRLKPYLMSRGWWGEQVMTDPVDGVAKLVQLGSTRRLRVIFQTNMATAFAAGQWARIQSNKKALPYLRYNKSAAGQPRDSHRRYYGLVLPVEHPIWKQIFPPNGYGCQCSVSQLSRKQAEREGISGEPDVDMVEFTNPRTGQTVLIPADITPSFAHNHGDRLGALQALFGERHGEGALDEMIADRERWLADRYRIPPSIQTTRLPEKAPAAEIARLTISGASNNTKPHEAEAAAQWQELFGVRLEVYDGAGNSYGKPDYWITDDKLPKEQWQTLDFMFTEDAKNPYRIEKMNQFFAHTEDAWADKRNNVQQHLRKADIVPIDLRHLNGINRARLLAYVLSLPQEQQDRIRLIVSEAS